MSIFEPPPFNPTSLFDNLGINDSDVDDQFALFEEFNTEEAKEERQNERDQRLEEINAESGEIVNSLIEKCEEEKNRDPVIDPETGIIVIVDGCFDDCEDCNDIECLLQSECAEEERNRLAELHQEKLEIEEKNELDLFEPQNLPFQLPIPQAQIDESLIQKYQQLVLDWGLHVVQNGIIIPIGVPTILSAIVNPLIATPPLARETATTIYNRVKAYNQQHALFQEALFSEFEEYNSEEEKQKRLEERLARRDELIERISELEEQLAAEQERFEEIQNISESEDSDIIFITGNIDEPEDFEDGFSFTEEQLERIDSLLTDIFVFINDYKEIEYLTQSSEKLESDLNKNVVERLFPKKILIEQLESERDNLIETIEGLKRQDASFDLDIIAIQLQLVEQVNNVWLDDSLPNLRSLMETTQSIVNNAISIADLKKSITHSNSLPANQRNSFADRIDALLPAASQFSVFNDKLNLLIDSMPPYNGPDILIKNGLLREILDAELRQLSTQRSRFDDETSDFQSANLRVNEIQDAIASSQKIDDLNSIISIIIDIDNFIALIEDFQADVLQADPTESNEDIFDGYDANVAAYQNIRDRVGAEINKLDENEKRPLTNGLDQQERIDRDLEVLYNSFDEQESKRNEDRNAALVQAEAELEQINSDLEEANNLEDDSNITHSYSVIVKVSELIDFDRNVIVDNVESKESDLDNLLTLKAQKETELENLDPSSPFIAAERAELEEEINSIENEIENIKIPDLTDFNTKIDKLIDELRYAISNGIAELQQLIESLQFEVNNPDVDPPYVPPEDPFDEVQNACEAIIFGFMSHLVRYGLVVMVVSLPVFPFITADTGLFSANLQSEAAIRPVAIQVANEIKSGASIESPADLPAAIIRKIVFGLYFQSSSYLSSTGTIVGITTGALGRVI